MLGEAEGLRSPLSLPTAVGLVDVTLGAQGTWTHRMPAGDHAFVFVIDGAAAVNGQRAGAGSVVRTRADGDLLAFAANGAGARFTLFTGMPLAQRRVLHGPFVARDAEQATRFMRDHASGRFGALVPMARA